MMLTQPGQVVPRSWRATGPMTLAGDSRANGTGLLVHNRTIWRPWEPQSSLDAPARNRQGTGRDREPVTLRGQRWPAVCGVLQAHRRPGQSRADQVGDPAWWIHWLNTCAVLLRAFPSG